MPNVFAVRMPPTPVLDVIFSLYARVVPRLLRSFAIVRMDGFEPIEPKALVEAEPSECDPLRARPCPASIRLRQEYELRNTGGQQPEPLLALSHTLFGLVLLSAITCDLDVSCVFLERHQKARGPKSRAITPLVPSIIRCATLSPRPRSFVCSSTLRAVLRDEDHVAGSAKYFSF